MSKSIYRDDKLTIINYSSFLSQVETSDLFKGIVSNPIHFKHNPITLKREKSKKRNKTIYGSIKTYVYEYMGKKVSTPIIHWDKFPLLFELSKRIEKITHQQYNTCVIQIYNSGIVDIKPHRDKEMTEGSIIASISLGQTRVMKFERKGMDDLDIPLKDGDLCLIIPPTNDHWLHSIPADSTKDIRISLVFRNF